MYEQYTRKHSHYCFTKEPTKNLQTHLGVAQYQNALIISKRIHFSEISSFCFQSCAYLSQIKKIQNNCVCLRFT